MKYVLYFYISTFRSLCSVPDIAVFFCCCSCRHGFILWASGVDSFPLYTVVVFKLLSEKWHEFYTHRRDNIAHTRPTASVFFYSLTYLRKEDAFCWHKSELNATETSAVSLCLWSSELLGRLVECWGTVDCAKNLSDFFRVLGPFAARHYQSLKRR